MLARVPLPRGLERHRFELLPVGVVAATVVFTLYLHHGQQSPPTQLNDSGLHESMVRWVADRIGDLHSPFDGWWPYMGLGFPQTHQYQSLPHALTAAVGAVTGVELAYDWSLYLLLAVFPVAIWGGARLLDLGKWPAACAALVAPVLVSITGYGYESVSYTWQGFGLWPQLWAACLLPIALGLTHRCVRGAVSPVWPAVAVAATIGCHFLTGWLVLVFVCLMPLLDPRRIRFAALRAALVVAGAGLLIAWLTLPVVLDAAGADYSGYPSGSVYDSFGFRQIMAWLVSGDLLDAGRLPVVTALAGVGLPVTIHRARAHLGARVVLLVSGISLVLLFGRPTLGPLADLLPYGGGLFFPRFIIGVHLGGILLAGIGITWLSRRVVELLLLLGPLSLAAPVLVLAVALVLTPPVVEQVRRANDGRDAMAVQRRADATSGRDLLVLLDQLHHARGRVYSGANADWGKAYVVGLVPVFSYLLANDIDAVGFQKRVSSIGTIVEPVFDGTDRRQYDLFGVRWAVVPEELQPPVPATRIAQSGRHVLWGIDGVAYGQVVDVTGAAEAEPDTLAAVVRSALTTGSPSWNRLGVAWRGREAPAPTGSGSEPPGEILIAVPEPDDGTFTYQVELDRDADVALAASWHPRWTATVDGTRVPVGMVLPGTPAARVPAGRHVIVFRYEPFQWTWLVLLVGVGLFVALAFGSRRWMGPPVPSKSSHHGPHHA